MPHSRNQHHHEQAALQAEDATLLVNSIKFLKHQHCKQRVSLSQSTPSKLTRTASEDANLVVNRIENYQHSNPPQARGRRPGFPFDLSRKEK